MSPDRTLTLDDFHKQPRGPYSFDRWVATPPLENPLGPFDVEFREPPDGELVWHANDLAIFVTRNHDAILDAIYENYLRAAEETGWMKACGVPARLQRETVPKYLRSREIGVDRKSDGRIDGTLYFSPLWDIEHGIYLEVVAGKVLPKDL